MTPIFRVSQSILRYPKYTTESTCFVCLDNQLVTKGCFNGNKSFQLDRGI